ncbi:hypothetical protein [Mycobacterium sp. Root265]|nr:hypothetical protein [Mycobacterium sp. Root265]
MTYDVLGLLCRDAELIDAGDLDGVGAVLGRQADTFAREEQGSLR